VLQALLVPDATENLIADLVAALRERLAIIGDDASRRDEKKHLARLRSVSAKIDDLQAALPKSIDPRLTHYLERKSYDKALEFLEHEPPGRRKGD
jgi:hypothetical protein